jgi:L-histidine Nalpha-methyltransferase
VNSQTLNIAHPDIQVMRHHFLDQMAQDVLTGLRTQGQKQLPPVYFYDEAGSRLYHQITRLPEYYLTRCEEALLYALQPELSKWVQPIEVVELGSGSATKTPILLDSFQEITGLQSYTAIDVDPIVLGHSLAVLQKSYSHLRLTGLAGRFEETLSALPGYRDRLFVFLGSTLSNFTPTAQQTFFLQLFQKMEVGNSLLLGFDILPHAGKPIQIVEQAYNDTEGVTAQFNVNMLRHLNMMLGMNFEPTLWAHHAVYNIRDGQIEMYLKSLEAQTVRSTHLNQAFYFKPQESILTEISRKFNPKALADWFNGLGLTCLTQWTDEASYFGLMLLQKR